MNRFEFNAGALRGSAVMLLLAALAGGALLWWSSSHLSAQDLRRQQALAQLGGVREQYRQALEAQDIISTSQRRYLRLEQRGFVGEEPRLVWIEALRDSGRKQRLYALQYDLRERRPLQVADLASNQHYQVYASFMHLDMELAHEVDLLRYFRDLESQRPAVWQLRGCTLTAVALEDGIALDKPNVKAGCDLAWYTVRSFAADAGDNPP